MSKIKWGAIVVDGRGKLGGHVFTKTRSGATMRTKVTPVNPQTPAQAAARSRLGSQSQAWRGLSEEQRIGWNELAARTSKTNIFGDQYFPTGKNLFTGVNSNILLLGGGPLDSAPEPVEMPVIVSSSVSIDTELRTISLAIETAGTVGNSMVVVEATAPASAGRFNFDGSYRIVVIGSTPFVAADLYTAYAAKFGDPSPGQKVAFRMYYVNENTGQTSSRFAVTTIAA